MTKTDFLSHLEKRLSILKQKERADILAEYSQHIDIKMQSGLSEEDAIKDFGDVDELADEILDAYNVNPNYNKKKINVENAVARFFKKFGRVVNAISDEILKKKPKELFSIFFKLCIVGFCLLIVKIPIDWVLDSLRGILSFLPHFLTQTVMGVISFCFNIVYLVVVLFTLYSFVKKMLIPDYVDEEDDGDGGLEFVWESHNDPHLVYGEYSDTTANTAEQNTALLADAGVQSPPKRPAGKKAKKEGEGSLLRIMTIMLVFVLKICVFFFLLPFIGMALAVIVGFGILVTLLLQGYPVIGLTLGALGGMLCLLSFIGIVAKGVLIGGGKLL